MAHAPRHAPKESGNDAPATVGDQLADPGTAQSFGLSVLPGGFGVRESREEFEPATAPIGV